MINLNHRRADVVMQGEPLAASKAALILVHGRGASAHDILTLAPYLPLDGFSLLAPQADRATWYPYSFLAPVTQNQPGLDSGLSLLDGLVQECQDAGLSLRQLYLLGFSQGACLTLEYVARHGQSYGGVFALSGGLIGEQFTSSRYQGQLADTPILLACSDVDPHIPLARVNESATWLQQQGAAVDKRIYPGMGHTVVQDELDAIASILAQRLG